MLLYLDLWSESVRGFWNHKAWVRVLFFCPFLRTIRVSIRHGNAILDFAHNLGTLCVDLYSTAPLLLCSQLAVLTALDMRRAFQACYAQWGLRVSISVGHVDC